MSKFYCKYCGVAFASVFALTNARCLNNPNGKNLPHVVYEGGEKSRYTCKYCGISFPSIFAMTHARCLKHPTKGSNHEPML